MKNLTKRKIERAGWSDGERKAGQQALGNVFS